MLNSTNHNDSKDSIELLSLAFPNLLGITLLLSASCVSANCYTANQLATAGALSGLYQSLYGNQTVDQPPEDNENYPYPPTYYPPTSPDLSCQDGLLQSITPDQVFAMGTIATRVNGGKITQPSDYFGLNQKNRQGGGAGDEDFPPLNFWGKVDSDFGSADTTVNEAGFDFDNHNFVFGADYRLTDAWVAGGSFSYRNSNASFDANRGETKNDSYNGTLYNSYNITEAAYINATASYAGFSYNTHRNIVAPDGSGTLQTSTANASPDGGQYSFSWGGGYDFHHHALTISPYARGEYINLDIDAYSESGSAFAARFGKQTIESLTSTLGIQSAYAFSFPWGVLIPQLRGEWHHQFMDGQRQVKAGFVNDTSNQSFILTSDGPTRDYYTFGAEVSSVLPGGISAFLAYESLLSYSSINSNKLMLGARLEF